MSDTTHASEARSSIGHSVSAFFRTVIRNRGLVVELVRRDLASGYARHGLGMVWLYAQPLVTVVTFMLIFGLVIGTRMKTSDTFPGDYVSYIVIGLTPWLMTQNALGRGPAVFQTSANLVKQVVFPIETLPAANLIGCIVTFIPCYAVMVAYKLVIGGGLGLGIFLLPLLFAIHAALLLGIILILSSLTPFIRDIKELTTVYMAVSMYFTPAIYLPDWVPAGVRPILYLNPFSYVVWCYQDTLFFGRIDHPVAWIVMIVMAALAVVLGIRTIERVKPFLGNVL